MGILALLGVSVRFPVSLCVDAALRAEGWRASHLASPAFAGLHQHTGPCPPAAPRAACAPVSALAQPARRDTPVVSVASVVVRRGPSWSVVVRGGPCVGPVGSLWMCAGGDNNNNSSNNNNKIRPSDMPWPLGVPSGVL
jgi:hypothetical protein